MEDENMAVDRGAVPAFIVPSLSSSNVAGKLSSFPIFNSAEAPVANCIGEQPTVPVVARPNPPEVRNYILQNREDGAIEVPGDLAGLVHYFMDGQHKPPSKKTRGRQSRLTAVYVKTGQMIVSTHIPVKPKALGLFTLNWIDKVCQTFGIIRPLLPEGSQHIYLRQAENRAKNSSSNALESLAASAAALNINDLNTTLPSKTSPAPNINDSKTPRLSKTSPAQTIWTRRLRSKGHLQNHDEKQDVSGGRINNGRIAKTRNRKTRNNEKQYSRLNAMIGGLGGKGADGYDAAMESDSLGQMDCGMAIDQTVPSPSKLDCRMAVDEIVSSPGKMILCMPPNVEGTSGDLDMEA